MPFRPAILRGQRVLARCAADGSLVVEGGRVEVRYKPNDGRAYRAAERNLELVNGAEILPDEHCAPAEAPVEKAKPATRGAPSGGSSAAKASPSASEAPAEMHAPDAWIAYTDGACSGNPGPAGLGVVLTFDGVRRELSEYLGQATNNIAELTAILRALENVADPSAPVVVHTDSQYAIGVLQKGWKAKANQDLIARIKDCMRPFKRLRFVYVRGHAGVPLNERADELARHAVSTRETSAWRELKSHVHAH